MAESLEEKVDRLELYVSLLRQIAIEPGQYRLWDWIIANELNDNQYNRIMFILKKYVLALKNQEGLQAHDPPTFDELASELIPVLSPNENIANEKGVIQLINNAVKMIPFQSLQYYLDNK